MRTIKCQICGKEVEAKSGSQKYCPECREAANRAKYKEYREKNKERKQAQEKEWRDNNKERLRAKSKEWYENNKERARAQKKEWYENNKEKIAVKQKEWRDNNKELVRAKKKEYRENHKGQIATYQKEWYQNNKEHHNAKHKEWYENNYIHADREGNNFCVYIHTDPIGKVYVGRSFGEDIETVSRQRWGSNGINYQGQKFYDECIAVYGWDNIQHELLEWGLTYEEVIEREQYWIERYNSRNPEYGYNVL